MRTKKEDKDFGAGLIHQVASPTADTEPRLSHTPGPWTVHRSVRNGRWLVDGPPEGLAGVWCVCRVLSDEPIDRTNAHLIAAAPDLLAVLRDLEWSRLNDGRGVTHVQCPSCFALQSRGTGHNHYCGLAAALAKAEGRS